MEKEPQKGLSQSKANKQPLNVLMQSIQNTSNIRMGLALNV